MQMAKHISLSLLMLLLNQLNAQRDTVLVYKEIDTIKLKLWIH